MGAQNSYIYRLEKNRIKTSIGKTITNTYLVVRNQNQQHENFIGFIENGSKLIWGQINNSKKNLK